MQINRTDTQGLYAFSVGRDAVPRVPDISLARLLNRKQTMGIAGPRGVSIARFSEGWPHQGEIRDAVQRIPTTLNKYQGFTLIELMVVVVIIAIVTAVIIPEMKGTYEDALLRSTSRKLVSAFGLAYSQAVTANQLYRVRLDKRKGRYFLEKTASEGGSGFVPVKDLPGGEGELDSRISFEIRKPGAEQTAEPGVKPQVEPGKDQPGQGADEVLTFYADGTAEDREIILKDREGFRVALRISPTTARVRIIEMERE